MKPIARRLSVALAGAWLGTWLLAGAAVAAPKAELVLAIKGESETGYDPLLGWGQYGHPLFQSTLLSRDADLGTKPDLATAWTLSDDRLTWTIAIRDGVRFSDGSALTAADVAFTFQGAAAAGGLADLTVLAGATAPDARTVVLRLKEPRITFTEHFYTLGIVPEKAYGPDYARRPVGSGPYRLVQWNKGQQLIVEANPHHHGPKPRFGRLTFLFTEEDATLAAARAGQVDVAAVPPALAAHVPAGMTKAVARSVDNRGLMFPTVPSTGRTSSRGAPIGNDVTADRAIRRAVNAAIDRRALVEGVLSGHGTPAFGPADGLPWSNPASRIPDGDGEAAREILKEGGWTPGRDGMLVKDGRPAASRSSTPPGIRRARCSRSPLPTCCARSASRPSLRAGAGTTSGAACTRTPWCSAGAATTRRKCTTSTTAASPARPPTTRASTRTRPWTPIWTPRRRAPSLEASLPLWRQAEWDGETGFGVRGDAAGPGSSTSTTSTSSTAASTWGGSRSSRTATAGPITAGILNWTWTCP
jgi:peptide/nickel transport system substrate-binding protein